MIEGEDLKTLQELVDMGVAFYVYADDNSNEPTGARLTPLGVKLSEEMYPNLTLHESYYKWRFGGLQ